MVVISLTHKSKKIVEREYTGTKQFECVAVL